MDQLTIEHQAREMLHVIALLVRCLQMPGSSQAMRQRWERGILDATRCLDDLYAAGLRRDFLSDAEARHAV